MERTELTKIVIAAQKGDSEALNMLFTNYYNDVYYFALKTLKDEDLACDITQETFIEIINTIANLNEPAAFVTWMKQIAYHQCTRYFKKAKDVLVDENEDGFTIFDTIAEERTEFIPDEALDKEDFRKTILNMIDLLSEDQRSATMMFYFDELSVKQIAQIQGVSEGTVKSRLNYARKAIKSSVEEYEKKNNVKLHSFGLLPLLLWLFKDQFATAMPAATAATVAQGVTAATGITVTAAAGGTVAAAATTAAGVSLGIKIAAIAVAATLCIGGGAVAIGLLEKEAPPAPSDSTSLSSPQTSESQDAIVNCGVIVPEGCTYVDVDGNVYEAGQSMPTPRTGDELRTDSYTYKYGYTLYSDYVDGQTSLLWQELNTPGWCVRVTDTQKASYPALFDHINDRPLYYLDFTFYGCENMTLSPAIPDRVQSMNSTYMFCGALTEAPLIPDSVFVMWSAFEECTSLTKAPYLPDGIHDLTQTFMGCTSLQEVSNLPLWLEVMHNTFNGCTSLVSVPDLPEYVTELTYTFARCSSLQTAPAIPGSVVNISNAFAGCTSLTGTIRIDSPLDDIWECAGQCARCYQLSWPCAECSSCYSFSLCFADTTQPITLTGDSRYLQQIAATGNNGNVTVRPASGSWVIPQGCSYQQGDILYAAGEYAPQNVKLDDVFTDGTYIYTYRMYGVAVPDDDPSDTPVIDNISGWDPVVQDTSLTNYAPILSQINGQPVTSLYETFKDCANMTVAPAIPDSVVNMWGTFRNCTSLQAAPTLPDGVKYLTCVFENCSAMTYVPNLPSSVLCMSSTFLYCKALTATPALPEGVKDISAAYQYSGLLEAPVIPDSVYSAYYAFSGTPIKTAPVLPANLKFASRIFASCNELTGEVVIHAELQDHYLFDNKLELFLNTSNPITLTGTSSQLAAIAALYENVTIS